MQNIEMVNYGQHRGNSLATQCRQHRVINLTRCLRRKLQEKTIWLCSAISGLEVIFVALQYCVL